MCIRDSYKIQGKGTYVKGGSINQNLYFIASCTEDVRRQGLVPSKRVIDAASVMPDKKRCRVLNISGDDRVDVYKRQVMDVPTKLIQMFPYVTTLLVLTFGVKHVKGPEGMGKLPEG